MNQCNIVGRVLKAALATNKNGKPFGRLRVEERKQFGEKIFSTRFEVEVYGLDGQDAANLKPGTLVWASGEVSAFIDEYNGKQYAKMRIVGKIGLVDAPDIEKVKREVEAAPAPAQRPASAQPDAQTLPGVAPEPEEDDVPF